MIKVELDGVRFWCEARWDAGGPGMRACWVPDVIGFETLDEAAWRDAHGPIEVDAWLMTANTDRLTDAVSGAADDAYEEFVLEQRIDDAAGS